MSNLEFLVQSVAPEGDCAQDPSVSAAFTDLESKRDTVLVAREEVNTKRDQVKAKEDARIALAFATGEHNAALYEKAAAEEELADAIADYDANPTDEGETRKNEAQGVVDAKVILVGEKDAAKQAAQSVFDSHDSASPSYEDQLGAAEDDLKLAVEDFRVKLDEYLVVLKNCQIADCGEPTIQTIQIKRGSGTPSHLLPGELAVSEDVETDDFGIEHSVTRLWIGDSQSMPVLLRAKGGVDTDGSWEKAIDDERTRQEEEHGKIREEIANLVSNLDTAAVDSLMEIVNKMEKGESEWTQMFAAFTDKLEDEVRRREEMDMLTSLNIQILRSQNDFEIDCIRQNLNDLDGGTFGGGYGSVDTGDGGYETPEESYSDSNNGEGSTYP